MKTRKLKFSSSMGLELNAYGNFVLFCLGLGNINKINYNAYPLWVPGISVTNNPGT